MLEKFVEPLGVCPVAQRFVSEVQLQRSPTLKAVLASKSLLYFTEPGRRTGAGQYLLQSWSSECNWRMSL